MNLRAGGVVMGPRDGRRPGRPIDAAHGGTRTSQPGVPHPPDPDEVELLRRVAADDLEAFESFFARYQGPVFATAFAVLGDRPAAEEVLQDTFAKAHEWRRRLRRDVSPLPWLHRVALNFAYTRLLRRRLLPEPLSAALAGIIGDPAADPPRRAERAELAAIVRDGIAALPEKQRGVIILYYLRGRSIAETAEILGVPVGTVKSRLHFGLRALRDQLEHDRRFGGAYEPAGRPAVGLGEAES